jgi:hypothetical protein
MSGFFKCLAPACGTVTPLNDDESARKCSSCGSTRGEWVSPEDFKKQFAAGAIFNVADQRKRAAKKGR